MAIYYQIDGSTIESRREVVNRMTVGLEKLSSQLPCLTAAVGMDPASKRVTLRTTGDNDAILFLIRGVDTVSDEFPSYAELEREHFGLGGWPASPSPSEVEDLERKMSARGCMIDSTKPDPNNPWSNMVAAPIKSAVVTIRREKIVAFKEEVAEKQATRVSSHDCVHTVLWSGIVQAKCAAGDADGFEDSWTIFPVTFRSIANPDFPRNYISNTSALNGARLSIEALKGSEALFEASVALRKVIRKVDAAYVKDAVAWLDSFEVPPSRTWMVSPPCKMDALFTSWTDLDYHAWDLGSGPATALRPAISRIPFVFTLPPKTDGDGEEVFEAVVAASEKTHEILMKDTVFRGFVKDYGLQP
ncbi:hypothetical protein F5Y16DRAFT_420316 [Xylariaceae sp. FL0255]|nr:hypothetical protein F5Y16DRAFT_420316 [Xylariaceae sp. FL0255]